MVEGLARVPRRSALAAVAEALVSGDRIAVADKVDAVYAKTLDLEVAGPAVIALFLVVKSAGLEPIARVAEMKAAADSLSIDVPSAAVVE